MITFTNQGDFSKTEKFLSRLQVSRLMRSLPQYGDRGVRALQSATPIDSGETALSWSYRVSVGARGARIEWFNSHQHNGAVIAILIQYGHGTGTGGYVSGRDYINPAMKPIFDEITNSVWREVTSA